MPRRHEGPRLWKTGYYYCDFIIGFPPSEKRLRYSLKTQDAKLARTLWERERARQWSVYYGETTETPVSPVRIGDLINPFIRHERDVRKAKTWRTFEQRLNHVKEAWRDPFLKDIGPGHVRQLEARWPSSPLRLAPATGRPSHTTTGPASKTAVNG